MALLNAAVSLVFLFLLKSQFPKETPIFASIWSADLEYFCVTDVAILDFKGNIYKEICKLSQTGVIVFVSTQWVHLHTHLLDLI